MFQKKSSRITRLKFLLLVGFIWLMPFSSGAGLNDIQYTPDPTAVQQQLSKITLQFMDAGQGISGHVDVSGITLSRGDGNEVYHAMEMPVVLDAKLILEFYDIDSSTPATITAEGVYTLHIPEGAVTAKGNNPITNDEINIDFTIKNDVETPMTRYTLTPSEGEVEGLTEIVVGFPESGGLDWFHNNLFSGTDFHDITLTKNGTTPEVYTAAKKSFDYSATVKFAFLDSEGAEVQLTQPGRYTLDIPAGMFQKDMSDIRNSHIVAEYIIPAPVPEEFIGMITSPADGEFTGQLQELSMNFPAMTSGIAYPVQNISNIVITTPTGKNYYAFNPMLKPDETGVYNTLLVNFAETADATTIDKAVTLTAAGHYIITIGEGVIKVDGKDVANPQFTIGFDIDPELNFTYLLNPASGSVRDSFAPITLSCGSSIKSVKIKENTGLKAEISLSDSELSYELTTTETDSGEVVFTFPQDAISTPGVWTLHIPEGFFEAVNNDGLTITNRREITAQYTIKEAEKFNYTIDPTPDSTIEFFKNAMITFEGGNLRSMEIDKKAGLPTLSKGNVYHELVPTIGFNEVSFAIGGGAVLDDGIYTVDIPAGYIITVDKDKLKNAVEGIKFKINVKSIPGTDYSKGILFLNEGWFGFDSGSINYLDYTGEWVYDAFLRNNPSHSLGITSQFGQCFGDKIYVTSKDAGEINGIEAAHLVVMDASTLNFEKQIFEIPDREQPRAFCAWNEHKGYVSTASKVYIVNLDNMQIEGDLTLADPYPSFNGNGEMLRYGDYIFLVRQATGIDVIDPTSDSIIATIKAEVAESIFVLPDGSLMVATLNENNEFIKISNKAPFEVVERYDIDFNKSKITSVWETWSKAPIAVSKDANEVYYVTKAEATSETPGIRHIARYNFDDNCFTPDFITIPRKEDGETADWMLYGEGVSVDPITGNILLTAVEYGGGIHYKKNKVFVADPVTGIIDLEASHTLEPDYWFPAMTLYPDFEAPVIDTSDITLTEGATEYRINLEAATSLATGNKHLVNYNITSLNPEICEVIPTDQPGVFDINVKQKGSYALMLNADYQGKIATRTLSFTSSVKEIVNNAATYNVYNTLGVLLLRNATSDDLKRLDSGIYIVNGRKFIVH